MWILNIHPFANGFGWYAYIFYVHWNLNFYFLRQCCGNKAIQMPYFPCASILEKNAFIQYPVSLIAQQQFHTDTRYWVNVTFTFITSTLDWWLYIKFHFQEVLIKWNCCPAFNLKLNIHSKHVIHEKHKLFNIIVVVLIVWMILQSMYGTQPLTVNTNEK